MQVQLQGAQGVFGTGRLRRTGRQIATRGARHGGNDLPFLWPIHARHRSMLFRSSRPAEHPAIRTGIMQLSRAIEVMRAHRHTHTNELADSLNLRFAQRRGATSCGGGMGGGRILSRRALEFASSPYRRTNDRGDLRMPGPKHMAVTARNCCPGPNANRSKAAWCAAVGIPRRGADFAAMLRDELAAARRSRSRFSRQRRTQAGRRRHAASQKTDARLSSRRIWLNSEVRAGCRSATFSTFSNTPSTGQDTRHFRSTIQTPVENQQRRAALLFASVRLRRLYPGRPDGAACA